MDKRDCIACWHEFEPERKNQKRCRDCITHDRRATKPPKERQATAAAPPTPGAVDEEALTRELEERGYAVTRRRTNFEPQVPILKDEPYRVGVVGDTHIGSRQQQMTHLHTTYRVFEEEGIDLVLHTGDLFDGSPEMHKGMWREQFIHDPVTAVDYAVATYPYVPGIRHYIIGGNHDASFIKNDLVDAVEKFAARRDDFLYLGEDEARIPIGDTEVRLFHPAGGGGKVLHQAVKWVTAQPPKDLPDVLLMGHLHRFGIAPNERGVLAVEVPAFQGQSPFLQRKGIVPTVGALILTLNGPRSVAEWITYDEIKEDY